jgi:hypothetical protein
VCMPVALYLRVSTEEQRERQSIATQREFALCPAYAKMSCARLESCVGLQDRTGFALGTIREVGRTLSGLRRRQIIRVATELSA